MPRLVDELASAYQDRPLPGVLAECGVFIDLLSQPHGSTEDDAYLGGTALNEIDVKRTRPTPERYRS